MSVKGSMASSAMFPFIRASASARNTKSTAPKTSMEYVISASVKQDAFSTETLYAAYETTAIKRETYPMMDKLDEALTTRTVIITPISVIRIPAIWIFDGFFFRTSVDAASDTTGIQARNTPLSDAVVLLIPKVSAMN